MILHLQLKIFFDQQTFFEEIVRKLLLDLICEECKAEKSVRSLTMKFKNGSVYYPEGQCECGEQMEIKNPYCDMVYYANGNKASQEFLIEDVMGDPAIYPSAETLDNLFTTTPYAPKVQRVVTRAWTKIKSGI